MSMPGGEGEIYRVEVVVETAQANQKTAEFRAQVEEAKLALKGLLEMGAKLKDINPGMLADQIGPNGIVMSAKAAEIAFSEMGKTGVQAGGKILTAMQQDEIQIKRATQALMEMASVNRSTPLSVSTTAAYQQLGFEPATTTAALTGMGAAFDKTAGKKDSFRLNLSQLYAKFKEGTLTINDFSSAFTAGIGAAFGYMVVNAIFSIVNSVGQLIQMLNQATVAGKEFLDSQIKLSLGLRDAQRNGFDATRESMNKFMDDFKAKFPTFSTTAIVKGMSDLIFYARNMGITSQEAFHLFDSAAVLAKASGKDLNDVLKSIALAASSGYSESLQRMGLNINKVTITEKAHAQGVKESYMAMAQEERARATLALVFEQTDQMFKDAIQTQQSLAGVTDQVTAKLTDAERHMGTAWLPSKNAFDAIKAWFQEAIAKVLDGWNALNALISAQADTLGLILSDLFSGKPLQSLDFYRNAALLHQGLQMGLIQPLQNDVEQLKDTLSEMGMDEATQQKILGDVDTFADTLLKNIQDYQKSVTDATKKFQDDLAKIDADGAKKRIDLANKLRDDLAKVNSDLAKNIANATQAYQRQEDDDARAFARKQADAVRDEKRRELEIQQKYADDLKKLQNKMSFDLEEAVRAGDVIQIRKIQRQYKYDVGNLGGGRDQDIAQARRDLAQKLADNAADREFQRQQRAVAFQQKLADLQAQAVEERKNLQTQYAQSLVELQASLDDERKTRIEAYHQQYKDLYDAFQQKLKLAAQALAEEVQMNQAAMNQIIKTLIATYGKNGIFQQVYDAMQAYVKSGGKTGLWAGVDTSKLTTSSVTGSSTSGVSSSTSNATQSVNVRVDLGPDLVGKIVNTSVGVIADVMENRV